MRGREFEVERGDLQGFCAEQHFYRFGKEKLFALIEVQFWNNFDFSLALAKSKVYFKWISGHYFSKEEIPCQIEIMQLYFSLLAKK